MSLIQRMIQKMKRYIVEYDSGSIFGRAHYASKKKRFPISQTSIFEKKVYNKNTDERSNSWKRVLGKLLK